MSRFSVAVVIVAWLCFCLVARGDEGASTNPAAPAANPDVATEIAQLKAEVKALREENAALKEKLAAREKVPDTKPAAPADPPPPVTTFTLGASATLATYKYQTPNGWAATPAKDNKNGMLYRSPDKLAVIFVQVKPKGGAPLEMQQKYAQQVVQMLKADFAKSKTELLDPPAVQVDPRFFLKVHERIRVGADKVADQTHYYLMPGKDMIELSVITRSDATDQIAATQRLAEDLLLTFKAEK